MSGQATYVVKIYVVMQFWHLSGTHGGLLIFFMKLCPYVHTIGTQVGFLSVYASLILMKSIFTCISEIFQKHVNYHTTEWTSAWLYHKLLTYGFAESSFILYSFLGCLPLRYLGEFTSYQGRQ